MEEILVGQETNEAASCTRCLGCTACVACLICATCIFCVVPALGQAAIAAATYSAAGTITGTSLGALTATGMF